jgi:Stage II sporulation protein E (SpoIIE)
MTGSGPRTEPESRSADADEQRRRSQVALRRGELTMEQLWLRYFELGGVAALLEIDAYLSDVMPLPALQRDLLAHTLNERLRELPTEHRVPYSRDLLGGRPPHQPLAALVELLHDSHLAPPDRLAEMAATAGRTLGVTIEMYLIDHDQRRLVPAPGPEAAGRSPLAVDGTLAGQAFQQAATLSSSAAQPRLWVPLLDGVDRLGVLDVVVADATELADPALRDQCEALATALAHLVITTGKHGDGLDAVRRWRPRSPAAELVWQLLPAPTGGTEAFTVSGWLMPTDTVGGDSFDYALSETVVHLAIFDAMGHGLRAGLIAAAAVSAYRSARRNGDTLADRVRAIDSAVEEQFGSGTYATGVVAELDLRTGRLSYLSAGHPYPLVLRSGKIVKHLTGGRRVPFGLRSPDRPEESPAEERLQPGDWLVLHTDGITEARDAGGAFFGQARLIDLLERASASGRPPAETVRRVTAAVLTHQNSTLHDDATIVLAAWTASPTPTPSGAPDGRRR